MEGRTDRQTHSPRQEWHVIDLESGIPLGSYLGIISMSFGNKKFCPI